MHEIFQGIQNWLMNHGALGLGLNAWLESFIPFPPPDILLIGMDLTAPHKALFYALIATIGSAFGGFTGWLFGRIGGRPLFNWMFRKKKDLFDTVEENYKKYGVIAVAMAALTPVPYNIFAWASGILNMNPLLFTLISIFGRGARFFVISILLLLFGETVKKYFLPIFIVIFILLLAFYIAGFFFIKKKGSKKDKNNKI
ncbi:DedA family protein [bacterium]|nr:DedA family protein [bacterium]